MAGSLPSNYSDDDGVLSDINVTPLVDVVLVLLIVFMITVPALVRAAHIRVDLPETRHADPTQAPTKVPLELFLRRGEDHLLKLYLDDQPVTVAELESLIKKRGDPQTQPATFSCDKDVSYGDAVKVIDELASIGLRKLSLSTRHVEPGK